MFDCGFCVQKCINCRLSCRSYWIQSHSHPQVSRSKSGCKLRNISCYAHFVRAGVLSLIRPGMRRSWSGMLWWLCAWSVCCYTCLLSVRMIWFNKCYVGYLRFVRRIVLWRVGLMIFSCSWLKLHLWFLRLQ